MKFSVMMGMLAIALVLTAQPVMAQFDDMSFAAINLYGEGFAETPDSKSAADIGFQRLGVSLALFTLNVDYALDHYTWNNADKLSFGNGKDAPWENFHSVSLGGMYGGQLTEKWSYMALAFGSTAFEDGADNSYLNGLLAGAGLYTFSETLNFVGGAGVLYSSASGFDFEVIEDLPKVMPLPVLGVQWNQNAPAGFAASLIFPMEAKIQFTSAEQRFFTSVDAFTQQADVHIQFLPMVGATLRGVLQDPMAYRLAKESSVLSSDTKEAYFQRDKGFAELMLNVMLPGNFAMNVGPYYTFDQTFSVLDKKADELEKIELDNSFGAKFDISWSL